MRTLIQNALVLDPGSRFHQSKQDILLENGLITRIGQITPEGDMQLVNSPALRVSMGWTDFRASFRDPGLEHKEDLTSGAAAAAAGGFTHVALLPDTLPVMQTKAEVEYVLSRSGKLPVSLLPMGAATQNLEGKELAEMYDMHLSGAVAFSNANKTMSAGALQRALLYCRGFDALLCVHPDDTSVSAGGMMHEGYHSTLLGMKGIPAHAEALIVQRDLEILRYTGGRLHFSHISTAQSVDLIRKAKAEGLSVSCDVAFYHLLLTDEKLEDYDTNYKVFPPLRNSEHQEALIAGVNDGTIDVICSDHAPEDLEHKEVEFDYAAFGIAGIQSVYPVLNQYLNGKINEGKLIAALSGNPRRLLGLQGHIEEGTTACLTLFDPETTTEFTRNRNRSKAVNNPFFGQQLKGVVKGIYHKNTLHLS